MTERDVIRKSKKPVTVESLRADLQALGLAPGMHVLVHSSLSSLGWVCGGPVAVIAALEAEIRSYGTLIMPTHSGNLSNPEGWSSPAVPKSWWEDIRRTMPAFDPDLTPTRGMGCIPEAFRKQRGVFRSYHPQFSFAAWGEQAVSIVDEHSLDFGLGDGSPLGRLYELDGSVLLLGCGYENNTSFHLAEHRASYPRREIVTRSAPVLVEGHRRWKTHQDVNIDSGDFGRIGREFEKRHRSDVRIGKVGLGTARLFPQRLCVDFAIRWMTRHRR